MTLEDLKAYGTKKNELLELKYRIKQDCQVSDVVQGSYPCYPYTAHPIRITGVGSSSLSMEYKQSITKLTGELEAIEEYILNISDSLTRQILRLKYIDELQWEDVARHVKYSERHVRRIHNNIVKEFLS